jgi:FMN phosphatase YigB (HAD superfamily)
MPLRIGFDMDGVLADFSREFREYEARLFGSSPAATGGRAGRERRESIGDPEKEEERQAGSQRQAQADAEARRDSRRREDAVWEAIEATPNFWTTLRPLDEGAVRRIHELMLRHRWEVFFITQRPFTAGETVQRQTQRWLVAQGFDLPSVLVLHGSRGSAAAALRLDYHVDDRPQNCIDVTVDSEAKTILIVPASNQTAIASARKLGIGVVHRIGEALDILDQATLAHTNPSLFQRIANMVGWK